MKHTLAIIAALALATVLAVPPAAACDGDHKDEPSQKQAPAAQLKTASFRVNGMHCQGCSDKIKSALAKTGGIHKVEVKQADKKVIVTFDKDKISADKIAKMITEIGYPASAEV